MRSEGLSDKCVGNGGLWNVLNVVHGDDNGLIDHQTYEGPDGKVRRVSLLR